MNWYYDGGGGQRMGPVDDSSLEALLAAGTITTQTLVWQQGMKDWAPLEIAREARQPASSLVPATERCEVCGDFVPVRELSDFEGLKVCAACKPAVAVFAPASALPGEADTPPTPAWEDRQRLGLFRAAWETIKAVLTEPGATFTKMNRQGGLGQPLVFDLLVGTACAILALAYLYLSGNYAHFPQQIPNPFPGQPPLTITRGMAVLSAVIVPVVIPINALLFSGMLHLSLLLLGGARHPFETTFRVYTYSAGAAQVFQLVPVYGAQIAILWTLICTCIGIIKAQEIETWRGVVATVLPLLLCCGAFVATASVAMAASQVAH